MLWRGVGLVASAVVCACWFLVAATAAAVLCCVVSRRLVVVVALRFFVIRCLYLPVEVVVCEKGGRELQQRHRQ